MAGLNRRLESIEARRKRRGDQQRREALARLSDVELEAAEESLLAKARARGKQPPPTNELLEKFKQLEIEAIEQRSSADDEQEHADDERRKE
jgi:hypothetical protein